MRKNRQSTPANVTPEPAPPANLAPVRTQPGHAPPAASFERGCPDHGINWEIHCSGCLLHLACPEHLTRRPADIAQMVLGSGDGSGPCAACQQNAYALGFRGFLSCPDHHGGWDMSCPFCLVVLACDAHKLLADGHLGDIQQSVAGYGCIGCLDSARAKGFFFKPGRVIAAVRTPGPATKSVGMGEIRW